MGHLHTPSRIVARALQCESSVGSSLYGSPRKAVLRRVVSIRYGPRHEIAQVRWWSVPVPAGGSFAASPAGTLSRRHEWRHAGCSKRMGRPVGRASEWRCARCRRSARGGEGVPTLLWLAGVPREDVASEESPRFHGSIHPAVKMTESRIFSQFVVCVCGLGQGTRLVPRRRVILERATVFCGGGRDHRIVLDGYCWHWVLGEACSLLGWQASPAPTHLSVTTSLLSSSGVGG